MIPPDRIKGFTDDADEIPDNRPFEDRSPQEKARVRRDAGKFIAYHSKMIAYLKRQVRTDYFSERIELHLSLRKEMQDFQRDAGGQP